MVFDAKTTTIQQNIRKKPMFVDDNRQNSKNKWKNARDELLTSQCGELRCSRVCWIKVRLYHGVRTYTLLHLFEKVHKSYFMFSFKGPSKVKLLEKKKKCIFMKAVCLHFQYRFVYILHQMVKDNIYFCHNVIVKG